MRILSLATRYLPLHAGADVMMHQVHLKLLEMGHEVHVLAINNGEEWDGEAWPEHEVIDGVVVDRVPPDRGYEVTVAAVNRVKPDLLFGQFRLLPFAIERAYEINLPVVVFCHTDGDYAAVLKSGLVEMVDLFVFNSASLYESARLNLRHAIVNPPLEKGRVVAEAREPWYVTLVNLSKDKGPDIFYKLAWRFPDREFLGVEGGYSDQIKRDNLKNVVYRAHGPDIAAVYSATRVLLMPSVHESFGMAAVEAQLNGIPVIASDLPGLRDSLGKGAIFVKRSNIDGWAEALKHLDNTAAYDAMVARGRTNTERFNFGRDIRVLEAVLKDLVRKVSARKRPCIHNIRLEYDGLREYVLKLFREQAGYEPTEKEVNDILESAYRPDQLPKLITGIKRVNRAS